MRRPFRKTVGLTIALEVGRGEYGAIAQLGMANLSVDAVRRDPHHGLDGGRGVKVGQKRRPDAGLRPLRTKRPRGSAAQPVDYAFIIASERRVGGGVARGHKKSPSLGSSDAADPIRRCPACAGDDLASRVKDDKGPPKAREGTIGAVDEGSISVDGPFHDALRRPDDPSKGAIRGGLRSLNLRPRQ